MVIIFVLRYNILCVARECVLFKVMTRICILYAVIINMMPVQGIENIVYDILMSYMLIYPCGAAGELILGIINTIS